MVRVVYHEVFGLAWKSSRYSTTVVYETWMKVDPFFLVFFFFFKTFKCAWHRRKVQIERRVLCWKGNHKQLKKRKGLLFSSFKSRIQKKVCSQEVEYRTENLASFCILSRGMFEDLDCFRNCGLFCFHHEVNNIISLWKASFNLTYFVAN